METTVRVRYAETDQMGVVYYSNYLVWMEVGRVAYCKSAGFNYRDMERDDGVLLAVVEARCQYRAPAFFDDEVVVSTWIGEAGPRMVQFNYEMRHFGTGRLLAGGETRHIFLSRDRKPVKLPEKYRAAFGLGPGRGGGAPALTG